MSRRPVVTIPRPPAGALVITEEPGGDVRVEARTGARGRPRSVEVRRGELAPVARALDAVASSPPPAAAPRPPLSFAPPAPPVAVAAVQTSSLYGSRRVFFRLAAGASGVWREQVGRAGRFPLGAVPREAFEALAAAVAAAPVDDDTRRRALAALDECADAETWPNGRDDYAGRRPTEPRTLREYWALVDAGKYGDPTGGERVDPLGPGASEPPRDAPAGG